MEKIRDLQVLRFEELSSTQKYCKERAAERENLFVVAARQTGGHGTKGRSFSSREGGLYFSMLLHPENFPVENAFLIMARTAVAVCKTLESFHLQPKIKWPNDIHVDGKKICGILIENRLQGRHVDASLIGVGLNVNNDLPKELTEIAVSMRSALGKETEIKEVEERFRAFFFSPFSFEEYTERLGYIGQEATLQTGGEERRVTLLGVSEKGLLLVEQNGEEKAFSAGEVTLKGWKK